ncbi:MAG: hypothetical protein ACXWMS_11115, partial [Syntrophales bacterium]
MVRVHKRTMAGWKLGLSESFFRKILYVAGAFVLVILTAIFMSLAITAIPSIGHFGVSFLFGATWDPVRN